VFIFLISLRSDIILYFLYFHAYLHVNWDICTVSFFLFICCFKQAHIKSSFQSLLNNSVCMEEKKIKKRNNSHICNENISFFSLFFFVEKKTVTCSISLYSSVFFLNLSIDQRVVPFPFFAFSFFFPCYFALFFEF
jgi:hypothetical protein